MYTRISLAVLVLAFVGTATAQDTKPTQAANLQPFQGIWKPESIQFDGAEQMDSTTRDKMRLSIENGEYKLFYVTDAAKGLGRKLASSALTVTGKNSFELAFSDGPRKGEKIRGIFELTQTTLKVCYGPANKAMPTKLEAPKARLISARCGHGRSD